MCAVALSNKRQEQAKRFSIYSDDVLVEHREFYERIFTELNGIFPICNQGRCAAVDISDDRNEQEQITDLMKRVETFSGELLEDTKNLFDQYYQAKEGFSRSIYCATTAIKMNLMDRMLFEHSCDVRWWAQELEFAECGARLSEFSAQIKHLGTLLKQTSEFVQVPTVDTGWQMTDISEYLVDLEPMLQFPLKLVHSHEASSVYLEKAESLREELSRIKGTAAVIELMKDIAQNIPRLRLNIERARARLEEILTCFTIYSDLLIMTVEGDVIANGNPAVRDSVEGQNVRSEAWFQATMTEAERGEFSIQDIEGSKIHHTQTLLFSSLIRRDDKTSQQTLGVMAACFDFHSETRLILQDYMPKLQDGMTRDGWISFFTNRAGLVVASSDENMVPRGICTSVPTRLRNLPAGQSANTYSNIAGHDSVVFSTRSGGHGDFPGIGWTCHLAAPRVDIFGRMDRDVGLEIDSKRLMASKLIPDINKHIYAKLQDDKEAIQFISLNGIVFASKLGRKGGSLGPVFEQITSVGDFATNRMEELLVEMARTEFSLNLTALETLSRQAIDLIDRNLFERSASIRWWACDPVFWKACQDPSPEQFEEANKRLAFLSYHYPMYRKLMLVNRAGDIVACSPRDGLYDSQDSRVKDQAWFRRAIRTKTSAEYAVSDVVKSRLEDEKAHSLVYAGGVRGNGAREGESIGVLAIFFDWDAEAGKILVNCLPRDKSGHVSPESIAFFTNHTGQVIESSDHDRCPLDVKLDLPDDVAALKAGESTASIWRFKGQEFLIGSSRTKGYREYRGLGWCAHICRLLE